MIRIGDHWVVIYVDAVRLGNHQYPRLYADRRQFDLEANAWRPIDPELI